MGIEQKPLIPRYGEGALSDLFSSVVASTGVEGYTNSLGMPPMRRVCLVVVDGLGAEHLTSYASDVPFLSSLPRHRLPSGGSFTAGFPSTTSVSLTSLATGLVPALHGMIGYRMRLAGTDRILHSLRWDQEVDPLQWQIEPTLFEQLKADKSDDATLRGTYVASGSFKGSGLSRTAWRGSLYTSANTPGELISMTAEVLREWSRGVALVYTPELDHSGHRCGVGSVGWRFQLHLIDLFLRTLHDVLPRGTTLIVTGDHGMTNVKPSQRTNLDVTHPDFDPESAGHAGHVTSADRESAAELCRHLAVLSGEDRCRYLHAYPGHEEDLLGVWRELFGRKAWIVPREQAIDEGWFGSVPPERIAARVGDVIVACKPGEAISASVREPRPWIPIGLHGSLTSAEQHIPLLRVEF